MRRVDNKLEYGITESGHMQAEKESSWKTSEATKAVGGDIARGGVVGGSCEGNPEGRAEGVTSHEREVDKVTGTKHQPHSTTSNRPLLFLSSTGSTTSPKPLFPITLTPLIPITLPLTPPAVISVKLSPPTILWRI